MNPRVCSSALSASASYSRSIKHHEQPAGSFAPYWQSIQRALFPQLEFPCWVRSFRETVSSSCRLSRSSVSNSGFPGASGCRGVRARTARHWREPSWPSGLRHADDGVTAGALGHDVALRRICGWERKSEVPSESVFSRAFAVLRHTVAPAHACSVDPQHPPRPVGGKISAATPAIEARETRRPTRKRRPRCPCASGEAEVRPTAEASCASTGRRP